MLNPWDSCIPEIRFAPILAIFAADTVNRMIAALLSTKGYFFWLLVVSGGCFLLERIRPWRQGQKPIRKEFFQDVFFLLFNGHYAGILVATAGAYLFSSLTGVSEQLAEIALLSSLPFWLQIVVFVLLKDFIEWWIHRSLHSIPFLWTFHKLHHSIHEMDWIGNFRFHWMEIAIYKSLSYFPILILGADERIVLPIAIAGTVIGHLNHANIRMDYGFLRYVFNSPGFHIWHHDRVNHYRFGQNFAILFSFWDRLFGTAYDPGKGLQPDRLGFGGDENFPRPWWKRMLYPLVRR